MSNDNGINRRQYRTARRGVVPISKTDSALSQVLKDDNSNDGGGGGLNSRHSLTSLPSSISTPSFESHNSISDSLASLYLPNIPPQIRQLSSTIMNGLNWINQLEFNPSAFLQNFLPLNPFKRRGSTMSLKSNNSFESGAADLGSLTYNQIKFAQLLGGSGKLKKYDGSELIELSSFGLVELDQVGSGIGHEFQRYENDKPTWCDSCGEFLSTPVMNAGDNADSAAAAAASSTVASDRNISIISAPAAVQVEHLLRTYLQCRKCKYVCHLKCHRLIRIDCQPNDGAGGADVVSERKDSIELDSNNNRNIDVANSSNSSGGDSGGSNSTLDSPSEPTSTQALSSAQSDSVASEEDTSSNSGGKNEDQIEEQTKVESQQQYVMFTPRTILDLKEKILKHNEKVRSKGSGLGITLIDESKSLFRGFLRVHMNLTRPINVISGRRPPSIYDIINEEENQQQRRTLTSFYMPRDTVKNIHITSDSTSLQVIKAMLKKFKVVDNPQKFALYLRRRFPDEELQKDGSEPNNGDGGGGNTRLSDQDGQNDLTISKFLTTVGYDHSLKRLNDQERPLILQLEFDSFAYGSVDIVMQENDNADIAWDAFEVPELRNFLKILEREEGEHLQHVQLHYEELRKVLASLIEYEECKSVKRRSNSLGGGGGGHELVDSVTC